MEFSFLQLTDYNDLYTIAVGLSMAYIWVEAKSDNVSSVLPFFNFLRKIGRALINKVLNKKTKHQQEEEELSTQITYYVDSKLLQDETRGALKHIKIKVEEDLAKVKALGDEINERMKYFTRAEFLHVLSFDCFLFGLFLLIIGPVESVQHYDIDRYIVVMNGFMTLALLHCLFHESFDLKNRLLPARKVVHSFGFFVTLIITVYFVPDFDFDDNQWWRGFFLFYSLLICFIGFIAYTFYSFLACLILFFVYSVKIWRLSLSRIREEHEHELNLYRQELDEADKKLKSRKLKENEFQVNGEPIQTNC